MKRYAHNPFAPAIALAAVAATAVVMAVAVVLPARMDVQPAADAALAKRDARAIVTVVVERVDVASQPAVAVDRPIVPAALMVAKQRG